MTDIPYLDLYRRMLVIRTVELAIARKYPEQTMRCPVHLSVGQEAVSAGAAAALSDGDAMFGAHRSHGPYLAMGGSVEAMLAEAFGRGSGCCSGRGGSMHLVDVAAGFWGAVPIVGATIPIATGAAFAFALRGEKRVAATIFGEGATEEGVFQESVQYAVLRALPVVYVCENNRFAGNTGLSERRPAGFSIHEMARALGAAVHAGDGNDAASVYGACREAVNRARNGGGPSFLEFATYRWLEHCGPYNDHHLPCRNADEGAAWRARCPIERMEGTLLGLGLADAGTLREMRGAIAREVELAMRCAEQADHPAGRADAGVYAAERDGCA